MEREPASPLVVCILPEPPPNAARTVSYPRAMIEVLAHAGVCFDEVAFEGLEEALPRYRLLLTVGECSPDPSLRQALRSWVEAGGAWLAVAGVCGLPELFDVDVDAASFGMWGGAGGTLGEGYLAPDHRLHPVLAHLAIPLHYFNGLPARTASGRPLASVQDAHGRPARRAGLMETGPGAGHCLLVAPDVPGAIVRIRQGVAVTRDGVPSPDGTGAASDGVLKSDDGMALDWHLDRQAVRGVPGLAAFTQPVADQWAELVLRALFHLALGRGVPLPVLWLYPRNLPALAHLSHDTDLGEPERAAQMLDVLASMKLRSTWCVVLPGYPRETMDAIDAAGHELAMHFDAMSEGCPFTRKELDRQHAELLEMLPGAPVTNKNHYLRWEGDTEFFHWLASLGIRLDESKGASKTGEAGFNFGTCHPFRPVDPDGTPIDILELPTLTQDLMVFAPRELLAPLLEAAERHHGVLHLLFHPAHIDKPGVEDALRHAVAAARARGMEWWRACDLEAWERARRAVRWSGYAREGAGARVKVAAPEPLPGATLLWLSTSPTHAADAVEVVRWGFRFVCSPLGADAGGSVEARLG